ncbi:hypothetical protein A4X06_0g2809 [Tilletia controversa]|uniref:UDP-galactose transporter n=4 Tax=Tilletia TaxID=13289 RepID=A0A8X7MV64_9BASI|nr:hypothetical protein CF336_g3045 [Tilletia laevis]KAE8206772.1 hypothetical protein CF335_g1625 [Tilletia laevis]KAE8251104.1 hypothetical protein A4X06_0g2809 [Tilletia controversa]KAE8263157.1 hypothetical protein A4X03_0g1890 [Tilletia caries]
MFVVPRSDRARGRLDRRRAEDGSTSSSSTSSSNSNSNSGSTSSSSAHAGSRGWWNFLRSPKMFCLLALAVQNAAMAIVMHHSRVSVPPELRYNTATAVLFVELLKGFISLLFAYYTIEPSSKVGSLARMKNILVQVASPDCMKLAIPAALYVLQQRLQYTAAANLDPTTFTVLYQAKVLTTAFFSFILLRTRIHKVQWIALFGLALGVAVIQIQSLEARQAISTLGHTMANKAAGKESFFFSPLGLSNPFSAREETTQTQKEGPYRAIMNPFVGFLAVGAACMTSGFAGVYFEMLLKGRAGKNKPATLPQHNLPTRTVAIETSHSDDSIEIELESFGAKPVSSSEPVSSQTNASPTNEVLPSLWIRNVQLSLLSLPPAVFPVLLNACSYGPAAPFAHITHPAALLTIAMQVIGGILTALVIKHADNILKGFAVAFSVLLSFAWSAFVVGSSPAGDGAGAVSFDGWFFLGSALTLASTFLYNRHSVKAPRCSSGGDTLRERGDRNLEDKGSERDRPSSPSSAGSSSLAGSQSEQPILMSSACSPHRQYALAGPSTSILITGSNTASGRSADPSRTYKHITSGQRTPGTSSASSSSNSPFVAPRLMAEAEAAWAKVVSYTQIPLATTSREDDNYGHHRPERRESVSRPSDRVADGREDREKRRHGGVSKARYSIDDRDDTTSDGNEPASARYARHSPDSAAAAAVETQSLLSRLPHASASSPGW